MKKNILCILVFLSNMVAHEKLTIDIFHAIKTHDHKAFDSLLKRGEGTRVKFHGKHCWTTLGWALQYKNLPTFERLLHLKIIPTAYTKSWEEEISTSWLTFINKNFRHHPDYKKLISLLILSESVV